MASDISCFSEEKRLKIQWSAKFRAFVLSRDEQKGLTWSQGFSYFETHTSVIENLRSRRVDPSWGMVQYDSRSRDELGLRQSVFPPHVQKKQISEWTLVRIMHYYFECPSAFCCPFHFTSDWCHAKAYKDKLLARTTQKRTVPSQLTWILLCRSSLLSRMCRGSAPSTKT